jgi:hypothetical protein
MPPSMRCSRPLSPGWLGEQGACVQCLPGFDVLAADMPERPRRLVFRLDYPQKTRREGEIPGLPTMKHAKRGFKVLALSLSMGAPGLFLGCSTIPTHEVSVDAISDGQPVFSGLSYRLVARDPVLTREVLQYNLALACVNAALGGKGMYAASGNNHPDILIELDYGEAPMLVLPGVPRMHELYLQLSARKYRADAPARNYRGEEIWNVRVSVKDPDPGVEHVLPLLTAVAADYAGSEHQPDSSIEVPDNAPTVVSIKNAVASGTGAKPDS